MLAAVCAALIALVHADVDQIVMPGVLPQPDSYVCTYVPLDGDREHYITAFKPIITPHRAHHILLFGCEEPGSFEPVWDCGEMTRTEGMGNAPTCASKPNILYAWALDAPDLTLPKDVGFKVGGSSGINYLVMQVHYMEALDVEDHTAVNLTHTETVQPKVASTMLLVTGGEVQPLSVGTDHWTLIGRRDPQLPQMFVPVENKTLEVRKGDMLAARCVIANNEDRVILMGQTGEDEMCNFYIMYWTEGDHPMRDNTCFSPGAPEYYWSSEAMLNHIPH